MKKFQVGDSVTVSKTITPQTIQAYADLSGDHNPIHLDPKFAAGMRFGKCIAHGMLTASLISNAIGNHLPGRGALYLGQTLKFTAPVFADDTVTARLTVIKIREDKPILTIETIVTNQRGERVIEGEAAVMLMAGATS